MRMRLLIYLQIQTVWIHCATLGYNGHMFQCRNRGFYAKNAVTCRDIFPCRSMLQRATFWQLIPILQLFIVFFPPIVLTCVYPLALLRVNDLFFCAGDRTATDRSLLGGWCQLISFGKLNMVDFLGVADATEQTWTEQSQSISIFYSFNWYIGCNNRVYPVANWRTSRLLHHILNTSQHGIPTHSMPSFNYVGWSRVLRDVLWHGQWPW